jgi:hypothetical protein
MIPVRYELPLCILFRKHSALNGQYGVSSRETHLVSAAPFTVPSFSVDGMEASGVSHRMLLRHPAHPNAPNCSCRQHTYLGM